LARTLSGQNRKRFWRAFRAGAAVSTGYFANSCFYAWASRRRSFTSSGVAARAVSPASRLLPTSRRPSSFGS